MRFVQILSQIIFVFLILTGISAGAVTDEHTIDEWRSILAVHDVEGRLIGLQMSLSIEPDQYYLPVGTQVNLSGELYNVFGPLSNVPIILGVGYGEKPQANITLTTNERGEFAVSDIVNKTGPIRFQAWFEGTDREDTNRTASPDIEINGITPAQPVRADGDGQVTSDKTGTENGSPGTMNESQETGAEMGMNQTGNAKITLQADTGLYTSGQNITFSGLLTGLKNTPLAHTAVSIEIGYGDRRFEMIGDPVLTGLDGTYSESFHLTGPDSPVIRAVSSDEEGNPLESDEVSLSFSSEGFAPPSRIRPLARQINAELSPSLIQTGENITMSGWFADGNGNAISQGRLTFFWYNFADKVWDRYKPGADVITSKDGYYAINVSGPKLTGVTYLAMVSRFEENRKPLFSRALPLTVRNASETAHSILPAFLDAFSIPDEVPVMEPAEITFQLSDPTGNPLAYEPIQVFFSEDGFTWYMNGNGNLTTGPEGMFSFTDVPKQPGFHYYRGVYNGTESYGPADSGILVIAITGNETEQKPVK